MKARGLAATSSFWLVHWPADKAVRFELLHTPLRIAIQEWCSPRVGLMGALPCPNLLIPLKESFGKIIYFVKPKSLAVIWQTPQ